MDIRTLTRILASTLLLSAGGSAAMTTPELLLDRSVQRWRWESEWLNLTDSTQRLARVAAVGETTARYFEAADVRGFCVSEFGICDAYIGATDDTPELIGHIEFATGTLEDSIIDRFAQDCIRRVAERVSLSYTGRPRLPEKGRTFDPEHFPPSQPLAAMPKVRLSWFRWAPHAVPHVEPSPESVRALRAAALKEVSRFRGACSEGMILVPKFTLADPWVLVYVDLGRPCEKGVIFFSRALNGDWVSDHFDVEVSEVRAIRAHIQRELLITEKILAKKP